jgi:gliding motility-associated-like protein
LKKIVYYIIIILPIVFLLKPINSHAQHVLNGSFEDNNLPSNINFAFGDIGAIIKYYIKNVEYKAVDTISVYSGSGLLFNLPLDTVWLNYVVNSRKLNIKYPPHGKVYICIQEPYYGKTQQVMFLISDSLKKGNRYTVRFYAGNCYVNEMSKLPIMLALSKNSIKAQTEIDSFYIKDATGYREYVTSFIADDTYKYINLYLVMAGNMSVGSNRTMIDNIRLDTCVTMLPVIYKSCVNFPDTLKPTTTGKKYYWSTGDTTTIIVIKKTGNYRAYVYDSLGCCSIDSFVVTDYALNVKATDASKCVGENTALKATNANSYKWNTGDTTQTITIDKGGLYWVTRSTPTCTITDTFKVTEHALPIVNILPDTTVCFNNIAQILLDAGAFKSYLWKPTNDTTRVIYSKGPQTYNLQVTDSNNCKANKTITVIEECEDNIYVSNAFTPNGDGLNDVFNIVTTGLEKYAIQIYNRWGQEVFSSNNYLQGWDGKNALNDVYVYQITYKVNGKPTQTIKGTVTLIR